MFDFHLFKHRICKLIGLHYYYESKYGIKGYNKLPFTMELQYKTINVDPSLVYLGFDALKDKYTLLDINIGKSPHYELMSLLKSKSDFSNCEYILREKKGYLDGRYEVKIPYHEEKFTKMYNSIQSNNYKPAIIYFTNGKYYAFDGKHRLALCYLLGKKCKCICMSISELKKDETTRKLLQEMKKRKGYEKNIHFLESIFDVKNEY